jgi:fatty-acyl-CoA synthase
MALARRCGYDGIEPRAGSDHQHGIELHTSALARREIRQLVVNSGVALACIAVGCHYVNPATTQQQTRETLSYIDLAADVGATRLRVFGGDIPADVSRTQARDLVVEALRSVADHAARRGVVVCLETHDSWSDPHDVREVMCRVDHPAVAATWDVMHPVRAAGLTMDEAYQLLAPWIRHVHIHDGSKQPDRLEFKPIGTGDLNHRRVVELLQESAYQGYLSGEWIGWDSPESYLPRELAVLKQYERELIGR